MRENSWIQYGEPDSDAVPASQALRTKHPVDIKSEIAKLPNLDDAHYINIVVRRDGKDEVYEADWLKYARQEISGKG